LKAGIDFQESRRDASLRNPRKDRFAPRQLPIISKTRMANRFQNKDDLTSEVKETFSLRNKRKAKKK
jgi:hypothetical protein